MYQVESITLLFKFLQHQSHNPPFQTSDSIPGSLTTVGAQLARDHHLPRSFVVLLSRSRRIRPHILFTNTSSLSLMSRDTQIIVGSNSCSNICSICNNGCTGENHHRKLSIVYDIHHHVIHMGQIRSNTLRFRLLQELECFHHSAYF